MTFDVSIIETFYTLLTRRLDEAIKVTDIPGMTLYLFEGPGGVEFTISYINMGKKIPIEQEFFMNDWKLRVVRTPFPRNTTANRFDRVVDLVGDPDDIVADITALSLYFSA